MCLDDNYKCGQYEEPQVYAVKYKDPDIRMASRSGGVFTAFSDVVLKSGGAVYGCVMENITTAVHTRAVSAAGRDKMRGSKYIQSELRNTFACVLNDLKAGKKVLFSGTPCQVAGLKSFLGVDYQNLILIDIVCHGVPSPLVWRKFVDYQIIKNKSEVSGVEFRNKKDFGWSDHVETVYFKNGGRSHSRIFKNMYYGHNILRPACYECPYKDVIHPGDITIGDYWGIKKASPGFDDNKGVSLVLINNERGQRLFEDVTDYIVFSKTKIQDSMQAPLKDPFSEPGTRDEFWYDLQNENFDYMVKKYGTISKKVLFKRMIKKLISR